MHKFLIKKQTFNMFRLLSIAWYIDIALLSIQTVHVCKNKNDPKHFQEKTNLSIISYSIYRHHDNCVTMAVQPFIIANWGLYHSVDFLVENTIIILISIIVLRSNILNICTNMKYMWMKDLTAQFYDCFQSQWLTTTHHWLSCHYFNCHYVSSPEAIRRINERRFLHQCTIGWFTSEEQILCK